MDYVALGTKTPPCRLKPCHLKLESGWRGYFYNIAHALLLFTHRVGD